MVPVERHADGKRPHGGQVVAAIDGEVLPIDARFKGAVHRPEKVIAVRLNVKADQICAEHSIE